MLNLEDNIEKLELNNKIEKFLKDNKIYTISEVINKSKSDLKSLGLIQNDISDLEIKTELQGFKLKGSL